MTMKLTKAQVLEAIMDDMRGMIEDMSISEWKEFYETMLAPKGENEEQAIKDYIWDADAELID